MQNVNQEAENDQTVARNARFRFVGAPTLLPPCSLLVALHHQL